MATVSYTFEWVKAPRSLMAGVESDAVPTASGFFLSVLDVDYDHILSRDFSGNLKPLTAAAPVDTVAGSKGGNASASLLSGNVVTAYDCGDLVTGDIYFSITTAKGAMVRASTSAHDTSLYLSDPTVAALKDGGFVMSWVSSDSGDRDVYVRTFTADGSTRGLLKVFSSDVVDSESPAVAGLTNGGFVLAFSEVTDPGGQNSIKFLVYGATNELVSGKMSAGDAGTYSSKVTALGLKDGGFALAWATDAWEPGAGADTDIALQIFNANGVPRTEAIRANLGATAGIQSNVALSQTKHGEIVAVWDSSPTALEPSDVYARVFAQSGKPLTAATALATSGQFETLPGIASLKDGSVATLWSNSSGDAQFINGGIAELVRTSIGNAKAETIKGDALTDHIFGSGGHDKLFGGRGDDRLSGGRGEDELHGGKGDFKDVFVFSSKAATSENFKTWDQIYDFDAKVGKKEKVWDRIDLSDIDADGGHKGDQKFRWEGNDYDKPGKKQANGQVIVDTHGKGVMVKIDYNGDNSTDDIIQVLNVSELNKADFIL